VRSEFFHAANAVHGSHYFKVLDDAAFFAASSLVADNFLLTASFNMYFARPTSGGTLIGKGRVLHRSSRVILAEAVLTDENERELGRGSGSFMRSSRPWTDLDDYPA
jgi:uncharacterized protein (TIGR00369 family)